MKTRQEYNKEILKQLEQHIKIYPDMRFCQILYMLNIMDGSDKFYEESSTTFTNLKSKTENK